MADRPTKHTIKSKKDKPQHTNDPSGAPPPPLHPIASSDGVASAAAFLPTNFTILAYHAWHTLTLGLGTRKSKVVVFVFESEGLRATAERLWPAEIPLGEIRVQEHGGSEGILQAVAALNDSRIFRRY
ncbi:Unknown protein [Striga hermonthica]|uniref:DUF7851 domain-containing protein n=1 Tax=Striga hermonthica TaxID=68872 RepID=A0A9N7RN17_STRHE|nr:Unknown protein [Striga hermonthica]